MLSHSHASFHIGTYIKAECRQFDRGLDILDNCVNLY